MCNEIEHTPKAPFHAFNNTWRFNAYFFIGWDFKDYNNYLKKNLDYCEIADDFTGDGHSLTSLEDGAFIWTKEKDFSIIAHEAFHSSHYLLESAGVKTYSHNDEPLAYLLTWFIRNCGEDCIRGKL